MAITDLSGYSNDIYSPFNHINYFSVTMTDAEFQAVIGAGTFICKDDVQLQTLFQAEIFVSPNPL